MSRYAYIPLDYDNIDEGLERELVLDYKNRDLYVLDDYKIPVSATKSCRKDSIELSKNVENLENDFLSIKNTIDNYVSEILNISDEFYNQIYQNSNSYIYYSDFIEYITTYKSEIDASIDSFADNSSSILNNYNTTVNSFLDSLSSDIEKANKKLEDYQQKVNTYQTFMLNLNNECTEMSMTIDSKMNKNTLETGSGTYSYKFSEEKSTTRTYTAKSHFSWMSNSSKTYPANDKGAYKWTDSPQKPATLYGMGDSLFSDCPGTKKKYYEVVIDSITYPSKYKDLKTGCTYFTVNDLKSYKWEKGNKASPIHKNVTSTTPLKNTYYKKVNLIYQKSETTKTTIKKSQKFKLPLK
jgi:hypothetical protein